METETPRGHEEGIRNCGFRGGGGRKGLPNLSKLLCWLQEGRVRVVWVIIGLSQGIHDDGVQATCLTGGILVWWNRIGKWDVLSY